ncbi:MAG: hypothetical protein ACKUBY_00315 [Candidatus Moraniibacteriota bacterium]|jgi:hypothetical protein
MSNSVLQENCFLDAVRNINMSGQSPMVDIIGSYECGDKSLYLMRSHLMSDQAIVLCDVLKVFPSSSTGIALKKYERNKQVGISHVFPVLFSTISVVLEDSETYREGFYGFAKWCKDVGINCIYTGDDLSVPNGCTWINHSRISGKCNEQDKLYVADLKQAKEDPRLKGVLDFIHII